MLGKIIVKCAICNKEFEVYPYRKDTGKYCSMKCMYKGISTTANLKRKSILESGMKKCSLCKEIKQFSDFYTSKQKRDGYDSWCKKCKLASQYKYLKNPEAWAKRVEFRKKYNLNTKERRKFNRMKRLYGVTFDKYEDLINKQKGICAICGDDLKFKHNASIDHCHKTNNIRGILCTNCNSGLGHFKDDRRILGKAIKYLKHHTLQGMS